MLLGISIGGFFALAGATVVRLVTIEAMGKGMSIVFMGLSAGLVVAPALATLIGEAFGWRTAFMAAACGLLALLMQAVCLPHVPATSATSLASLFGLSKRRPVRSGLVAGLLFFGGEVSGFTFMRPYLETNGGLSATSIAPVLLVLGLASLLGSAVAGVLADRVLRVGFGATFLLLAIAAVGLLALSDLYLSIFVFAAIWGIAVGAGPVMTQTWMGRAAPDQLEGVGGLCLAVIQLGVTFGAIAGGIAVDVFGTSAPLYVTAVFTVLAAVPIAAQRSRGVDPRRLTSELVSSE